MIGPPTVSPGPFAERYTIEREIGRGATATVYLARDTARGRAVAIKVLRPELAESTASDRFLREIRLTSALQHPRILPVLDAGEYRGRLYFVLPYVEGDTLRTRLTRDKQLPITDAIAIARTIAEALDHAHKEGLIHRDIKPENILLTGNEACLADFGIARALEKALDDTTTSTGIVRGTPAYMSPEQASGERHYDGRSDVFSLGCVLYEMLAGVPAFTGPTRESILAQRFIHPPRDVRVYRPTVPALLESVVKKALEFEPADRFRTAGELADALTQAALPENSRVRRLTRGAWRLRARPLRAAAAALVVLLAAGVLARNAIGTSTRLTDRDWILVGDFHGPSDEPSLGPAVRELVTAELNQSRFVGTVTRQQLNAVMRLAGVPETTHVDAELARQLAFRSAVRAIVVGSVQRIADGRYSVAIHVVRADDGRDLRSVATSAASDDVVRAVANLARGLRRDLGERQKDVEATIPLNEVATPSFAAYQKYVDGLTRIHRGDAAGSNALFRQAIALDSQFASAWAAIGINHLGARQLDSAQVAFARALEIPGRLTAGQRYRLQGDIAYAVQYDVPAAIRWYDLFLVEIPRSVGGRNNRALYLSAVGRYEDAVADLKAAIAANPLGPAHVQISLFNLAAMLVSLGRLNEAEAILTDLKRPFLDGARLLLAIARDRWPEAQAIATAIDSQATVPALVRLLGTTGRASALAAAGAVESAARDLREARDASTGATARWYERAGLLLAIASGQRPAEPSAAVQADPSMGGALARGLRAAITGDTVTAHRELRRIETATSHERALLGHGPALVRAWNAAAGGRWTEVTQSLATVSLAGEHDATLLDRVSSLEMRWLVSTAYASQGKLDSASLHMKEAISVTRVPAGHLALRGLVLPMAHGRLASWSADNRRTQRDDLAARREAHYPSAKQRQQDGGLDAQGGGGGRGRS